MTHAVIGKLASQAALYSQWTKFLKTNYCMQRFGKQLVSFQIGTEIERLSGQHELWRIFRILAF